MSTEFKNYINGEWVKASSSDVFEVMSSGTGELYATVPQGTADEANRAVTAAEVVAHMHGHAGEHGSNAQKRQKGRHDQRPELCSERGGLALRHVWIGRRCLHAGTLPW